jgi:hypothetical protein
MCCTQYSLLFYWHIHHVISRETKCAAPGTARSFTKCAVLSTACSFTGIYIILLAGELNVLHPVQPALCWHIRCTISGKTKCAVPGTARYFTGV